MDLSALLHEILLASPPNYFDAFLVECNKWYEAPAHTFVELRTRLNKKIRGDLFENFCVLYLERVKGYDKVWRLEDVPDGVLETLGLKRKDMGIDIVAQRGDAFIAVQCKYKKVTAKATCLTWKSLSTFYALCMRSGPWNKYIVMTTCSFLRRVGKRTEKDLAYCIKTFQGMSKEEWVLLCGASGNTLVESVASATATPKTVEELRAARLEYYANLVGKEHTSTPTIDSENIVGLRPDSHDVSGNSVRV